MKTLVPGLYRGVEVWRKLCDAESASLDQLAGQTGYPKASVLRMLKTLCDLQLVERNEDGLYRAVARIASSEGAGRDFDESVSRTLKNLSAELGATAEWFEPDVQGLLLTQRCSPPEVEVHVKARAGFVRQWDDELDAVAALGYAFYDGAPSGRARLTTYGPQGQQLVLSAKEARERIEAARAGVLADSCYNTNGVKRISAAVLRNGELSGVLSLALVFTPSLELKINHMSEVIRRFADTLEKM